ncbi:MAG: V-type ATP synthase subunit I [Pseudomonadota bacterium]|nr:V-type ATP synthase subunit I [Pseudomonadota bacterium]
MSIVKLVKLSVFGLARDKNSTLDALQDIGAMHLIDQRQPDADLPPPKGHMAAHAALRWLMATQNGRRPITGQHPDFNVDDLVAETLEIKDGVEERGQERDFLRERIAGLEPWGDFSLPELDDLSGNRLWFYIVPHFKLRHLPEDLSAWEIVHSDNENAYLVVIASDEPGNMPVVRTHTGSRALSGLYRDLEEIEVEIEDLQGRRAALTRWNYLLAHSLARVDNQHMCRNAAERAWDDGDLFVVRGWIPAGRADEMALFAKENALACIIEQPGANDHPPTLLDNPDKLAGGEEIIKFYSIPGYDAVDPSLTLFFSFSLFFAMIMSDAGYAAVMGLILLFFRKKLMVDTAGRRLGVLFATIVGMSLLWGICAGSYFGITPSPNSENALTRLAGRLKFIDLNQTNLMMAVSIAIGATHVAFANIMVAWRARRSWSALQPLGWVAMIVGAGQLAVGMAGLVPLLVLPGKVTMIFGAALILMFGSTRRVISPLSALLRGLDGLLALTNVTKIFGDVLSYLRLFALGLASASLAITFNQLAAQATSGKHGFGILLAILILLIGHGINFVLAIMGGVVHGLRLNVIEFYNWCVTEEGHPFRAFTKTEVRQWSRSS